ncbi:hypothetical protein MASR2M117_01260 [Paludibacter sp.]
MRNLKLTYYNKRTILSENIGFLNGLFNTSKSGILVSVLFIGVLVGLDSVARQLAIVFCNSSNNVLNLIANILYKINEVIGIKFLDYFKDVIVIVAGVLGVILGLFFTTFMSIITTKYSNFNGVIINQLLEHKLINKYLKFLAILVSSAIIFQFLLIIGYNPTFVSAFLFTVTVIVGLLAFVFLGRYSITYFNAGNLVSDLKDDCEKTYHRYYYNKSYYRNNKDGKQILLRIIRNIDKIKLITQESVKLQLNNTDLQGNSDNLLELAIYFNSIKHTFPSNKEWFPKIQKYKSWDETSSIEYEMFSRTGATPFPQNIDDYLYVEKKLIDSQFFIFKSLKTTDEKIQSAYNQHKYLQVISFQCEVELFEIYFNQLEQFIKDNLQKTDLKENRDNLQFISLYATLFVQYLVGFNFNLEKIITKSRLHELAKSIHNNGDADKIMHFPFSIRLWVDKYQEKLRNENFYDGKITTPLFYTEYELAYQFQLLFKSSFEKISDSLHKKIISFSDYLKKNEFELEALEFLSESLDLYRKIDYFSGNIENKIVNVIDALNSKNEDKFAFLEREKLLERNTINNKHAINQIWDLGLFSFNIQDKELPDIYGNVYQLICKDILDKAFENNGNELIEYLPKFYTYNLFYIDNLRKKIDPKQIEYTSSKLFPVIVDLFEISAIIIVLFKAFDNKVLEHCFFDYWKQIFKKPDEEKNYWKSLLPVYDYFSQPLFGMSTSSYAREQERQKRLENYLKQSDFVRLDTVIENSFYDERHYVTDLDDVYLKEIIRTLGTDNFSSFNFVDLSEIFIECYLRQRDELKELDIKETEYGRNIRRNLEKDSE